LDNLANASLSKKSVEDIFDEVKQEQR